MVQMEEYIFLWSRWLRAVWRDRVMVAGLCADCSGSSESGREEVFLTNPSKHLIMVEANATGWFMQRVLVFWG